MVNWNNLRVSELNGIGEELGIKLTGNKASKINQIKSAKVPPKKLKELYEKYIEIKK